MLLPNLPFNGRHPRDPWNYMDHYSFTDPVEMELGRLSWPSWFTHSGRLTHEVVTRQPWIRCKGLSHTRTVVRECFKGDEASQ